MNYVNTHKPTNRTLAVIDGGLNLKASPDFSPVKKNKAALYGIRAVSPNSYAKGEARPYGNTVYNRTNGISATGASWSGGKI
jgi:hypothetical protein